MRFKRSFVLGCLLTIAPAAFGNIFLTAQNDPSGGLPVAAVAQDLNNDRVSDIATANQNGRNVSVFLGNRDGTFGPANNFQFGPGAVDIVSGDLDGDGKADLVVADGSTSVNVALGRGDGTFGPASTIKLSDDLEDQAPGIAIADFQPAVEFSTGGTVGDIVMRDLNHDQTPEAIVSDLYRSLTVLFNTSHAQ